MKKIITYCLPLTWFVWIMWKLNFLKKDYDGFYRGDPEIFFISRWIFRYTPITGKTKKGTKYVGKWKLVRFILWEVNILIYTKQPKNKIKFP